MYLVRKYSRRIFRAQAIFVLVMGVEFDCRYWYILFMNVRAQAKAVVLRRSGMSVKDIARLLSVSPSSVSRWCADVVLTPRQQARLTAKRRAAGIAALAPWIEKNRQSKIADVKHQKHVGISDIGTVSKRDLYMLGLGLYWGEGYKRGSDECGFTNSDPEIIRVILRWFGEIYGIERRDIIARVTINSRHAGRASRIMNEWSALTGIPLEQFTTPSFITTYSSVPTRDTATYRGTLRIKVRRGTSLRRRILAGIEAASVQLR